MKTTILLSLLALPHLATAAPTELAWQGRVLDAAGGAANGPVSITVALYATETAASSTWSDTFAVVAEQGFVEVVLGSEEALDLGDFTSGEIWATSSVDGVDLGPRAQLLSVPYALVAGAVVNEASPGTPCEAGAVRWDPTAQALRVCTGSEWESVGPTSPIGTIVAFAGVEEPDGWLFCDGSILSITDYIPLYSTIGTNFGGDARTTFGVPDLRGRFPRGVDNMGGTAANRDPGGRIGNTQNDTFESHSHGHSLAISSSGRHDHNVSVSHSTNHNDFLAGSTNAYGMDATYDSGASVYGNFTSDESHTHGNNTFTGSISDTGDTETRPENQAVNYLIRYE